MNYTTLYEAWMKEKKSNELQSLEKGFYIELCEHIRAQRDELQMLDEKTLRAKLVSEESERIEVLLKDVMRMRFKKILETAFQDKSFSTDLLTTEEEMVYRGIVSALEKMRNIEKNILKGRVPRIRDGHEDGKPKRLLIRFLQALPAIIGPDTKTYGPFKEEDIASLPLANAESLIKRGIAVEVELE